MLEKIIAIATMILLIVAAIRLLKAGAKLISFLVWLLIVSLLVYLALPWLDPILQNVAVEFSGGQTCYGLILESGDCFGFIK
jgi:hypothetical protein